MYINLSHTFDRLGKMVAEQQFSTLALSFFWKMGVVFAFFKSDGKFKLNTELQKLETISKFSLIILTGIFTFLTIFFGIQFEQLI